MDLHFAALTSLDIGIFYFISNRDATSDPNPAAFCRFRKERELLIPFPSRLDLWLWVIFIDDRVMFLPARD